MSAPILRHPICRVYCLLVPAILVLGGCFGGEYKRRMDQSIYQLQQDGERAAAVFAAPSPVLDANGANTGVAVQLPVFVDANAESLTADAPQAQPPFFNLPNLAYAYRIPGDSLPAFVYFAAVPADQKPADVLAQEVEGGIAKSFSGAAWQDVSLQNFSGGTVSLKRLSVSGPQAFGKEKAEGQFDLYLVSSASHHVLIGWRAPSELSGFFEKVAIAMGTATGG